MNHDICESCGLPSAPHNVTDCFKELVHKKKVADELFNAALNVEVLLGDPEKISNKKLQNATVAMAVASWRYAM